MDFKKPRDFSRDVFWLMGRGGEQQQPVLSFMQLSRSSCFGKSKDEFSQVIVAAEVAPAVVALLVDVHGVAVLRPSSTPPRRARR